MENVYLYSTCGGSAVEIRSLKDGGFVADAVTVCRNGGRTCWWFRIGNYKTLENAKRASVKKLAKFNIEIEGE